MRNIDRDIRVWKGLSKEKLQKEVLKALQEAYAYGEIDRKWDPSKATLEDPELGWQYYLNDKQKQQHK